MVWNVTAEKFGSKRPNWMDTEVRTNFDHRILSKFYLSLNGQLPIVKWTLTLE